MKQAAAKKPTTTPDEVAPLGQFGLALLDIGWQLAITVIGFLWLGDKADARYDTKPVFTLIAFGLVITSFVLIVRRVVGRLPKAYGGKQ